MFGALLPHAKSTYGPTDCFTTTTPDCVPVPRCETILIAENVVADDVFKPMTMFRPVRADGVATSSAARSDEIAPLKTKSSGSVRPADAAGLDVWARYWYAWVSAAYLRGYRTATDDAPFLPDDESAWTVLLDAFLLHKAFYELNYELNNRPDWVAIPLQGIVSLLTA